MKFAQQGNLWLTGCVMIINMWSRLVIGGLSLCLLVFAQASMQMNLDQLAQFIRSELALKQHSDKQIAAYVKKVTLTEKLTDKTVIDLEAQGAGPKTLEALNELKAESAKKKAGAPDATYSPATEPAAKGGNAQATVKLASKLPPIPAPNSVRQQEMLDLIKQYALNYTQNLPNFICVEVMRRFIDFDSTDRYRSLGAVLAKVSYNEGRESYKVYSVNGKLQDASLDHAGIGGGAVSTGEFGSLMREIFDPKSAAEFGWDHWATLRGRRMAVFNYAIDSGHSAWSIDYSAGPGDSQRIITAYKGTVYADENSGEISRIKFIAVGIPHTFPVSEATEILDYDLVNVNGQQYICPLMAKLNMTAGSQKSRNEIEFRDYRKFGTESVIQYDMNPQAPPPEPLPASKTDEQPATTATPSSSPGAAKPPPTQQPTTPERSNPFSLPDPPPPPPNL